MEPVEKAAKALWEAVDTANEFPWETLDRKPQNRIMGVIRDVIHTTVSEELFFRRHQPPGDAKS